MPRKSKPSDGEPPQEFIECPNCSEQIAAKAKLCRYCDCGISQDIFQPCPECTEMVRKDATMCRYCRTRIKKPGGPERKREPQKELSPRSPFGQPGSYGSGVREQVKEVIVRQAMNGAPWREICAGPMTVNSITEEEIQEEVLRRMQQNRGNLARKGPFSLTDSEINKLLDERLRETNIRRFSIADSDPKPAAIAIDLEDDSLQLPEVNELIFSLMDQARKKTDVGLLVRQALEETCRILGADRAVVWQVKDKNLMATYEHSYDRKSCFKDYVLSEEKSRGLLSEIGTVIDDRYGSQVLSIANHRDAASAQEFREALPVLNSLAEQGQAQARMLSQMIHYGTFIGIIDIQQVNNIRSWSRRDAMVLHQVSLTLSLLIGHRMK